LLDNPGARNFLRQVSSSSSHRHPAQSLEPNFLFTVPASTTGPSRFPQSRPCGVLRFARFPCLYASPHPWFEVSLGRDSAPESFASRCGSRLAPSNCLTSWLKRQVPHHGLPRLPFRSHGPLFLFTAPGPALRTVSFSSVETLRRALVGTLPLSAPRLLIADSSFL
jgi:hypothetical protein